MSHFSQGQRDTLIKAIPCVLVGLVFLAVNTSGPLENAGKQSPSPTVAAALAIADDIAAVRVPLEQVEFQAIRRRRR